MNPLDWPGREAIVDGPPDAPSIALSAGPARVSSDPADGEELPHTSPAGFVLP